MRLFVLIMVMVSLTACMMVEPEPVEPTVQEELAEALSEVNGEAPVEEPKPSLFAFLKPKPQPEPETEADITIVKAEAVAPEKPTDGRAFAALFGPKLNAPKEAAESVAVPKRGLFGGASSKSTVVPGEVLPFGTVGVACGLTRRDMGKEVDKFPKAGAAKWRLFDTNPSSTGPRTQFITGFRDGCARQFTASLALFGSPALHEIHRYGAARKNVAYSQADLAYEKIKMSFCGVGRGKACPPKKADKLAKNTSFVSVYPRFGGASTWMELLLSDGKMLVSETRAP